MMHWMYNSAHASPERDRLRMGAARDKEGV